jgi:alpha-L-fucosidase 2
MNYWLAERANLAECHLPLFDLLETTRGPGSVTAKKYYSARGVVVHHNTDIWGDSGPIDGLGGGI